MCGSLGSLPAVKVILEIAGKQCLEQKDKNNRSPLVLATMGGHGEVVNFLLSEGGIYFVFWYLIINNVHLLGI